MSLCMYINIHTYECVCYLCVYVYAWKACVQPRSQKRKEQAHTESHACICVYARICVYGCICVYACMCVCVHVYKRDGSACNNSCLDVCGGKCSQYFRKVSITMRMVSGTQSMPTVKIVSARAACSFCSPLRPSSMTLSLPSACWTRNLGTTLHPPGPNLASSSSAETNGSQKPFCTSSWVMR